MQVGTQQMDIAQLLAVVTPESDAQAAEAWARSALLPLQSEKFDESDRTSFTAVDGSALASETTSTKDRFINAALLADWSCYSSLADRADYSRLRAVIMTFPDGFRVWMCRSVSGSYFPVAYTGWYPISEAAFFRAHTAPQTIQHRKELWPLAELPANGRYFWLFNYSIISQMRRSPQSRMMLQTYANDINRAQPSGLAAAVLSEESKKVVARFGMTYRGEMTHDGESESVFASHSQH